MDAAIVMMIISRTSGVQRRRIGSGGVLVSGVRRGGGFAASVRPQPLEAGHVEARGHRRQGWFWGLCVAAEGGAGPRRATERARHDVDAPDLRVKRTGTRQSQKVPLRCRQIVERQVKPRGGVRIAGDQTRVRGHN